MAKKDTKEQSINGEESDNKRYPDVVYRHRPGAVESFEEDGQKITFFTGNEIELQMTIVTPEIIRLSYYMEGDIRTDFSYAVDPEFKVQKVDYAFSDEDKYFEISTSAVTCRITKDKTLVHFYDSKGNALCKDEDGFYRRDSLMKGISEIKVTKQAPEDMKFFGLGDKAHDQNLRGRAFENWNTDAYAYERGDDPLYRSIPFYLALKDEQAYGIFLDNTYRTRFSFDRKSNNISSFTAEGGTMNYYFIYGPDLTTVSERYTKLTGTPEMPPMWAFGYHQCRWSYYPESRVRAVADKFREMKIPCDALYLDIDYMDEYRVFTWNKDHFPDPTTMIDDLKKQGFETIVMIDPGIKVSRDYFVYDEGRKKGYFCSRPDGEMVIAPVWPARCAFPDFTNPEVRTWWANLYEDHIADKKVSGIWNDMNEPAVFEVESKTFPDDIRHDFDGHPCSHKKAHNIYGMQMARASLEGIKHHNHNKRPFLLTRANFAGGQRYAALWTGDNISSWDHLKLANEQCQRLSISGYSFVGSDVGGFVDQPTGELFTRWIQLSIFHPLFRNHTMGYNVDGAAAVKKEEVEAKKSIETADQEPWSFGEKYTELNRNAIELRYRLLNYLYTAFRQYVTNGTPVIRPLSYYDQHDKKAVASNDQFMFGDHVLVSPVLEKKKRKVKTYFPKGRWYDFHTNNVFEGKKHHTIDAPIDRIPFFIKEGAVLPLREVMQYTRERNPDFLELNVYYSEDETVSILYEDAEEGEEYRNGKYLETQFTLRPGSGSVSITADREGDFKPLYYKIVLHITGLPFEPANITADGQELDFTVDNDTAQPVYSAEVDPDFEMITIEE